MIDVFVDVILPVLLVAAVGGVVADRFGVEIGPLSQVTFYLFSPCLVFDALATVELSGEDTARIAAAGVIAWVLAAAVSLTISRVVGHSPQQRSAVALVTVMSNGGNMGLPVAALAFDDAGFEVAVVLFVVTVLTSGTGGIVLASLAGGSGIGTAWLAPLKVPSVWAAVAGLIVGFAELDPPTALTASTATLGGAAIPVMLIVLGLHVRRPVREPVGADLVLAVGLRLGAGPVFAWVATEVVGLGGVAQRTAIVLGGMPTAVITTIYATQYNARPSFVTRAVIVSTLVSVPTLTVLVTAIR
jgi:predicted permease